MLGRYISICGLVAALAVATDAAAQQYTRVSVATDGTQGNGASHAAVFSGDGKIVAFTSAATNLVTGDTNGTDDVFVRDLAGHTTTRASVTTDGNERVGASGWNAPQSTLGSPLSIGPNVSLNQDGSIVAFTSLAPLDPADTNTCASPTGIRSCTDIYVRNRTLNQTSLISVAGDNGQANNDSGDPHVSGDGRYVIFTSLASNLVQGDNNSVADVFLRDRTSLTTTRISVSPSNNDLTAPSYSGRISSDGQIIAFVSEGQVVATADPVPCTSGSSTCGRAFVVDRGANTVTRIPLPADVLTNGASVRSLDLTPDGRYVALHVFAGTTGSDTTSVDQQVLLVYDRLTQRVEVDLQQGGTFPDDITISASGRFVSVGGGAVRVAIVPAINFDRGTFTRLAGDDVPPDSNGIRLPALRYSPDGLRALFDTDAARVGEDSNNLDDVYIFNRDQDGDGMPDSWESQYGLNPLDPSDATADPDADGVTNLQEYQNVDNPKGSFRRYFAEGAANSFFQTTFSVFNPNDQAANVVLEFLGSSGRTRSMALLLTAHQATSISLTGTVGPQFDNDFATVVESDRLVVADRVMTWDQTGYGSSAETAIESPGTTWYLAEGSTGGAFDLFYLLQNPGDTAANVTVNYLRPSPLAPMSKTYVVGPKSRRTIYVDTEDPALAATDVSAQITSDQPILAERSMYFSTPTQPFAAGHEGAAVATPSTHWFFAEGATGSFFDLFLLLANPGTSAANVQVTYLLPSGSPIEKVYPVGPQSRLTVNVDFEDPRLLDTPVSMIVESTSTDSGPAQPIVAERAMWWPSPNWYEAHLSAGATTTGTEWALAAGAVSTLPSGSETETYILIANTSDTAGSADVTLYYNGTSKTKTFTLAANSRVNVQVSAEFPEVVNAGGFGSIIQSNGPQIVVERAIYTNANGQIWAAGSDALGTKLQ